VIETPDENHAETVFQEPDKNHEEHKTARDISTRELSKGTQCPDSFKDPDGNHEEQVTTRNNAHQRAQQGTQCLDSPKYQTRTTRNSKASAREHNKGTQ
jgi:hypothetical protein